MFLLASAPLSFSKTCIGGQRVRNNISVLSPRKFRIWQSQNHSAVSLTFTRHMPIQPEIPPSCHKRIAITLAARIAGLSHGRFSKSGFEGGVHQICLRRQRQAPFGGGKCWRSAPLGTNNYQSTPHLPTSNSAAKTSLRQQRKK